jgi:hypothetical protein
MKILHLYEIQLLDGTCYKGEIAYKDDQKIVLRQRLPEQKLRIYNSGIQSIREVGWHRAYALT